MKTDCTTYNPFPSLIYHTKLDVDLESMEKFIVELAKDMQQFENDWNLWHSHYSVPSFELLNPIFVNLKNKIEDHCELFFKQTYNKKEKMELKRMWGCMYKKGGYMRPHTHHETFYNACFYVKNTPRGKITFTHPSPHRFNAGFDLIPQAGDLLIWPGWLYHEVPPVKEDGIRISIPSKIEYKNSRIGLENRQVDSEYI